MMVDPSYTTLPAIDRQSGQAGGTDEVRTSINGLVDFINTAAQKQDWIGVLQLTPPTMQNTGKVTLQWKVSDDKIIMKYGELVSFIQSGLHLLGPERSHDADLALKGLTESRSQLLNRRDQVLNQYWKKLVTESAMPSGSHRDQLYNNHHHHHHHHHHHPHPPPLTNPRSPRSALPPMPSLTSTASGSLRHTPQDLPRRPPLDNLLSTDLLPPRGAVVQSGGFMAQKTDKMLRADDADARWAAVEHLKATREDTQAEHADSVAQLLKDDDELVQWNAAEMLGNMGEVAGGYAGDLAALLSHTNKDLRKVAAKALGRMGPAGGQFAEQIAGLLTSDDASMRVTAVQALGHLGPFASPAAPHVAQCLSDNDHHVRYAALESLWNLGPEALISQIPAMISLLSHTDSQIRWVGMELLKRMGPGAESEAERVAQLLDSDDADVRLAAVEVLAAIGQGGGTNQQHIRRITALLQDSNTKVRWAVVKATKSWDGGQCKAHLEDVVQLLGHEEPPVRRVAAEVMSWIVLHLGMTDIKAITNVLLTDKVQGETVRNILEPLKKTVQMPNLSTQQSNLAAKFTAALLPHPDVNVRQLGLEVLCRVAAVAVAGVGDAIAACLRDPDARVRTAAVSALEQPASVEKRHMEVLKTLMNDQDTVVRCAAANSLRRIQHPASDRYFSSHHSYSSHSHNNHHYGSSIGSTFMGSGIGSSKRSALSSPSSGTLALPLVAHSRNGWS